MRGSVVVRDRWVYFVVAAVLMVGCDDDPNAPVIEQLAPRLVSPAVIPRQGSIRVVFNQPIDLASALDPSNFTVTNTCTGLNVPGSLRLAGDTLIFSPSQALPFLTGLSVRVQGILDANRQAMPQPIIFQLRTENPPVSDISWQQLASPTNDDVTGVSFVDLNFGFISTISGGIYRTDNGGQSFAALFKSDNIINTRDIRAVSADSVYTVGAVSGVGAALLRSVDGGNTFQRILTDASGNMRSLSVLDRTGAAPVLVIGGSRGSLAAWRYDDDKDSTAFFGPVGGLVFGNMADLSPTGANAVIAGLAFAGSPPSGVGVAYRSTDGGRTYTSVAIPAGTHLFQGTGFINDTDAFLLGDTSTVLRLNTVTGALTTLGATNGIPQTEFDPSTGATTTYFFTRARFAPEDRNVGWIIGYLVRHITGVPDVRRGVILMTRDGGQTFTRQAVQGAPDNGLNFPELRDIFVQSKSFSVIVGSSGFIAARRSDTQNTAALCAFTEE